MTEKDKFDPANVAEYQGKVFTLGNDNYLITPAGRFIGRPSIEGAKVKQIAGIDPELFVKAIMYLDIKDKDKEEQLEKFVFRHGQKPRPGLALIVTLTHQSVKEKNRYGFVARSIDKIE